jgi:hypothetical protein
MLHPMRQCDKPRCRECVKNGQQKDGRGDYVERFERRAARQLGGQ